MMHTTLKTSGLSALLIVALMLTACGGGMSTPEETLKTFVTAIKDGDGQKAASCVDQSTAGGKVFGTMMAKITELKKVTDEFTEAAVAKWGEEVREKIEKEQDQPAKEFEEMLEKLDQVKVEIKDDKATLTMPDSDKPMEMVQKDGKWLIVAPMKDEEAKEAEGMMKMFDAMVNVLKEAVKDIETAKDYEEVKEKMGAKMMEVMMGGMGAPPSN
jgi:hypothetical protein